MQRRRAAGRVGRTPWAELGLIGLVLCVLGAAVALLWSSGRQAPIVPARGSARPALAQTVRESLPSRDASIEAEPETDPERVTVAGADDAGTSLPEQNTTLENALDEAPAGGARQAALDEAPADAGAVEPADADAPEPPATAADVGVAPSEPELTAESCGLLSCSPGEVCCNLTCGTCVPAGESCDPTPCVPRIQYPVSFVCGHRTCSVGQVCCNPTCGTCVPAGESCDPTPCEPRIQYPVSFMCGPRTCDIGQVCCNPSCGTCVAAGESCDPTPC